MKSSPTCIVDRVVSFVIFALPLSHINSPKLLRPSSRLPLHPSPTLISSSPYLICLRRMNNIDFLKQSRGIAGQESNQCEGLHLSDIG